MGQSLTLTTADTRRLERALKVLLSPLEYEGLDPWRTEASRAVRDLLRAERSIFIMPDSADSVLHGDGVGPDAIESYVRHFADQDLGLIRQRELGLEVWSVFELLDKTEHKRTEIWNDWKLPNGILGATGVTPDVDGVPAGLVCYDRVEDPVLEDRQVELMRLLQSAFAAGVRTYRAFRSSELRFMNALEGLGQAVALCDARGQVLHANRHLRTLLAQEPFEEEILSTIRCVAASLGAMRRRSKSDLESVPLAETACHPSGQEYRITSTYLGEDVLRSGMAILATVQVSNRKMPHAEEVSARLGLTRRQAMVALAIARGLTNDQVADDLSISAHTARHHTENVYLRLNVHSRAQLVARLMELRTPT